MSAPYRQQSFLLPLALEEDFTVELWAAGVAGLEICSAGEEIRVEAYFPPASTAPSSQINLDPWAARGVRQVADRALEDRDWLADYRAQAVPFEVGRCWLLDPRDPDDDPTITAGERVLLRIPAMNAFGTGSHESTRLALELLEELDLRRQQVLDVGCGSGILAFAALRCGARSVVAYDFDLPSVITARGNSQLNALAPRLVAGTAACLAVVESFDLLLVNVLPERIVDDLPRLVRALRPGGRLISSGNLATRRSELLAQFAGLGLAPSAERYAEEWVAWTLVRSAGVQS